MLKKDKDILLLFKGIGIFTLIALILFAINSHHLETKYPLIEKKSHLKGKVISVGVSQSVAFVKFDKGYEFRLPYAMNNTYDPFYLNEFIQVGDSLFKEQDSDTLIVTRGGDTYVFVLGIELENSVIYYNN